VLALARSGAGGTVTTNFAAASDIENGTLVRLLPTWSLPRGGVYAVYAAIREPPTKVRALVDFIKTTKPL
jgi:DNA-binding transcriptional LysR family regulator